MTGRTDHSLHVVIVVLELLPLISRHAIRQGIDASVSARVR